MAKLSEFLRTEDNAIGSGLTVYATATALPTSGPQVGDQAFVTANNKIYVWNGNGWFSVATVNQSPTWDTEPDNAYFLAADGSATTITVEATDPDGFAITYGYSTSGLGNIATISQGGTDNRTFTVTPSTNRDHAGEFTMTFTASDGANILSKTGVSFTLRFQVTQNSATRLLLKANGTGDNSTFDDASTSNHTITGNGDVPQVSYSPFRELGYAVDFAGEWTKIKNSTFTFGTGDYTIEGWIYPHGTGGCDVIDLRGSSFNQGVALTLKNTNKIWPYYGGSQFTTGSIEIKANEWSHIALVRSSGTLKSYVNGKEDFSVSDTNNRNGTDSLDHGIGANYSGASKFDGEMYDWRVTNTAVYTDEFAVPDEPLTAISGTLLHVCKGPRVADYSSNAYVLEPQSNGPKQVPHSPYNRTASYSPSVHGGSATFPGTSDEIKTSDGSSNQVVLGDSDFTVEFWIYKNTAVNTTWEALVSQNYGNTGGWRCYKNDGTGQLRWYAGSTDTLTSSSSNPLIEKGWRHCAIVRSSGTLTIYIDGRASGNVSSHTYNYTGGSNGEIEIGKGTVGSTYPTDSNFTDVRIVSGTAVYTGDFTPPTGPLTATGGTYSSTTNVNTSITAGHTKLLLNMTQAKIRDVSQIQAGVQLYGDVVAASDQQHFSENTIEFPGTSDYITVQDQPNFKAGEPFVIEGWHYLDARTNSSPAIFSNYNSHTTGSLALFAGHGSSTTTQYQLSQNGSFPAFNAGTVAYGQWVHFAVQRNLDNNIQVYIDGTQAGSDLASSMALGGVGDNFYIGTSGDTIANASIDGKLHDFKVSENITKFPYYLKPTTLSTSNSTLVNPDESSPSFTASNVTLLCCHTGSAGSTTITDGSSNSTTITTNGNAVVSNFGPGKDMKSVKFDGTGDYLQCTLADTLGTADYTLEYWVYHNTLSGKQIHCGFNGFTPAFYKPTSNVFAVYDGSAKNHITPVANRWYHLAYVHDDSEGKMRIYANGALVHDFSTSRNINGTTFRIGDDGTSGWMNGYISNLRIIKNTKLYSRTFTPTTSILRG